MSHSARRRRLPRNLIGLAIAVAAVAAMLSAAPAGAYATGVRVDLRVLVITDGSAGVEAVAAQLEREGVPQHTIDLRQAGRQRLTAAALADSVDGVRRARYQGVVVPNENALPADELAALADVEREFGVRQIDAYTWAGPGVGLRSAWSGTLDGAALTVTAAGKADGFGHLAGQLNVDDRDARAGESYGYLGVPAASADFTTLVSATAPGGGPTGSVLGVYRHDGREELVMTLAANRHQTHSLLLGHALVNWLTRGVHLGHWRNWLSVHVDDVFLPDDRWHTEANCTVGDGCGPAVVPQAPDIRMTPSDVDRLVQWQSQQRFKLDLAFNAHGSDEAGAGDPLTAALLARRDDFRWINHTYSHPYLGCVQDFSVSPWRCATDPATGATRWVSRDEIAAQIADNVDWAYQHDLPIDERELVTGEHSGLRTLPQMPSDNPNLAPALTDTGVRHVASDASREPGPRSVGAARTVPRHPMNIFYNVATVAEEVDEYNWIYTSAADGGSGICERNPTSTCIAPLTLSGFADYIVPLEARTAFDDVVSADPRPLYAHQSNLTEDRILYPVLDAVLARYRLTFTAQTPVVNPRFAAVSQVMRRQDLWRAAAAAGTVSGYLQGGRVTVVNSGAALDVPITVPAGTRTVTMNSSGGETLGAEFGEAYGGQRSAWKNLARRGTQLLRVPA